MKRLLIIPLLLLFWTIDSIILPGFYPNLGGLGVMVFLIALLLSFGVNRWVVGWGLAISFLVELCFGFYFGSLMGTWLFVVWAWHILNRFFSLKPFYEHDSWLALIPAVFLGVLLFVISQIGSWGITHMIYDHNISFSVIDDMLRSPRVMVTVLGELMVLLAVIRGIYIRRSIFYG